MSRAGKRRVERDEDRKMDFDSSKAELDAQTSEIPKYSQYLSTLDFPKRIPENCLFVGSGDSLAAAIFIERWSNFKARAFDPFDLLLAPEAASNKIVHFISVSGRTKTNFQAAKKVRALARETVAVTANPASELAANCTKTIELKFTKLPGLTPGTNSFTATLLACFSLFEALPNKIDVASMLQHAKIWAEGSPSDFKGTAHFVGADTAYALAIYGAAKIFEFAGGRADYQLLEQFSHMNLFALEKNEDAVFLLENIKNRGKTAALHKLLLDSGFTSHLIRLPGDASSGLEIALFQSVHLQFLALNVALKRGKTKPAFLEDKQLLEISDKMIY